MKTAVMMSMMLVLVLAGCQQTLQQRVADNPGELMYHDAVRENIPANQITIFGIGLTDTEEEVTALHGEPTARNEYRFGRLVNLEYTFGSENKTTVLYHLEQGIVRGILVTADANDSISYNWVSGDTIGDMYGYLGQPTKIEPLDKQTLYYYDSFGYEVYLKKQKIDRVYFTTPHRGIQSPGTLVEETNNSSNTTNDTSIQEENTAPSICIQVITPAKNPQTGDCQEFPTPCDVPSGWEKVSSCE